MLADILMFPNGQKEERAESLTEETMWIMVAHLLEHAHWWLVFGLCYTHGIATDLEHFASSGSPPPLICSSPQKLSIRVWI